jgi:O-antigen/teichoic acid export membrane protein
VTTEVAIQPIRARLLTGFKWNVIAQIARQASRTVVAIALARLLTPSEFGLAGMALAFTGLAVVFSDVGLGVALVQRKEISEDDRCTAFWTSVGAGLVLTAAGVLSAPLLARFYGNSHVAPLFAVTSLSFFFVALQSTQSSLLQREMNFKALELRLIGATVAGGAAGLVAAVMGAGAWALVVQQLGMSVVSTVLLWRSSPWRPKLRFSRQSLRALRGVGGTVWGSRLLGFVGSNADNIIVGRVLGEEALGLYAVGFNLITLPLVRLVTPIQDTLFPAFSQFQDDRRRLADLWLRSNRVVMAIVAPVIVGLAITADDAVDVVLGARWHGVAIILQVLCPYALMICAGTLGQSVLVALGRTRPVFWLWVVMTFANIGAFLVGTSWGVVGVAAAATIVMAPLQLTLLALVVRSLDVPLREVFASMRGVTEAVLVMGLAVLALQAELMNSVDSPALRLVLCIAAGAAVYVPLCIWRAPEIRRDLRRKGRGVTDPALA